MQFHYIYCRILNRLVLQSLNPESTLRLASVNHFPILMLFYMHSSILNGKPEGKWGVLWIALLRQVAVFNVFLGAVTIPHARDSCLNTIAKRAVAKAEIGGKEMVARKMWTDADMKEGLTLRGALCILFSWADLCCTWLWPLSIGHVKLLSLLDVASSLQTYALFLGRSLMELTLSCIMHDLHNSVSLSCLAFCFFSVLPCVFPKAACLCSGIMKLRTRYSSPLS